MMGDDERYCAKCVGCGQTWNVASGADRLDGIEHRMIGGHSLSDCAGRIQVFPNPYPPGVVPYVLL